jgi:hypothetical protein
MIKLKQILFGPGSSPQAGFYEHCDEPFGSVEDGIS